MAKLRVDKIASVGVSTETTGSVFFDSSNNNHLAIQKHPDLEIHTNCTFECFINFDSVPTSQTFFLGKTNSFWIAYDSTAVGGTADRFTFAIFDGSSWTGTTSSFGSAPTAGRWYHLAAVKEGTSMKLYVDGKLYGSNTFSGTPDDTTNNFNVLWGSNNTFDGYVSNVRFIKDRAFYTSDFAAPTRELEVVDGTVLLCCYDGENIFADKTGRHIIAAIGDRTSSPTPTATDSPIGITTENPGLIRDVDNTFGPTFQGGAAYASQNWLTLPRGTTEEQFVNIASNANPAPRGLRGGGQTPGTDATIDFVTITTNGTAQTFGDLSVTRFGAGGIGSPTRGLFCGGGTPDRQTVIDFVTIATTGDAQTFGDLTGSARTIGGASGGNSTRGLTFGGATTSSTVNIIDSITIASTGDAQDFGDCIKQNGSAVISSPTRAVSAGGDTNADGSHINSIEFATIQTLGNAFDFGDLLAAGTGRGVANSTRGIFSVETPSAAKTLQYLNIASTGNTVTFGDLITNNLGGGGATYSSLIRGCFAGIRTPAITSTIEFAVIPTLGDVQDFGDLSEPVTNGGGLSNGHGGLG